MTGYCEGARPIRSKELHAVSPAELRRDHIRGDRRQTSGSGLDNLQWQADGITTRRDDMRADS